MEKIDSVLADEIVGTKISRIHFWHLDSPALGATEVILTM